MCIPHVQTFSVVASGTVLRRVHAPLPVRVFGRVVTGLRGVVSKVSDLILGNQIGNRIAMTLKTPAHAEGFGLRDDLHLIDSAVAGGAVYALCNVDGVVEMSMLGEHVNFHPFNRFACFVGIADELESRAFCLNHAVASHACFSRWNCSKRSTFNRAVAIPAVHTHLTRMQLVAERDRLFGGVSDVGPFGGEKIPNKKNSADKNNGSTNRDERWDPIGPLRKNGCHSITFMHEGSTRELQMTHSAKGSLPRESVVHPDYGSKSRTKRIT